MEKNEGRSDDLYESSYTKALEDVLNILSKYE